MAKNKISLQLHNGLMSHWRYTHTNTHTMMDGKSRATVVIVAPGDSVVFKRPHEHEVRFLWRQTSSRAVSHVITNTEGRYSRVEVIMKRQRSKRRGQQY